MTFQLTRRALLQGAGITLAGSVCPLTAVASGVKKAIDAMPDMYWGACVVNCGNRCALRVFTKNGQVIRIETDNTSNPCCPPSPISCGRASEAAPCGSASITPIA